MIIQLIQIFFCGLEKIFVTRVRHKPGSHDSISVNIRAKQKAKQRNEVKHAIVISIRS